MTIADWLQYLLRAMAVDELRDVGLGDLQIGLARMVVVAGKGVRCGAGWVQALIAREASL